MHDPPPPEFDNAAVVTDAVAMMNYAFTNDVEFEKLSIAAATRNVAMFLSMPCGPWVQAQEREPQIGQPYEPESGCAKTETSQITQNGKSAGFLHPHPMQPERPATPEDAAGKSREETPKEGLPVRAGAPRPSSATTELEKSATPDPARETGCEGPSVAKATDADFRNVGVGFPVTTEHVAESSALPDGAVATVSPPHVIDPGSWMLGPSPELEARRELSFREDRPNNRSLGALRAVPDASGVFELDVTTEASALGGTDDSVVTLAVAAGGYSGERSEMEWWETFK